MPEHKFSWPIIGHEIIGKILTKAMDDGRLPDAIGFAGPAHLGKRTAAQWLIKRSICIGEGIRPCESCGPCHQISQNIHPDVITVEPEKDGDGISVEQIRTAISNLRLRRIGAVRWLMIAEAEKLNESARNALLKIVEEPPAGTRIILTTSSATALPPTLRSRVALYHWNRVPLTLMRSAFNDVSWEMLDIAAGRPGVMKGMPTEIWREKIQGAAKRVWSNVENRAVDEYEAMMNEEEQALSLMLHQKLSRAENKSWFDDEDGKKKSIQFQDIVEKLNIYAERSKYLKANVNSQAIYTYVHNA